MHRRREAAPGIAYRSADNDVSISAGTSGRSMTWARAGRWVLFIRGGSSGMTYSVVPISSSIGATLAQQGRCLVAENLEMTHRALKSGQGTVLAEGAAATLENKCTQEAMLSSFSGGNASSPDSGIGSSALDRKAAIVSIFRRNSPIP
jgi:hypothetical protein